ncbi:MAG: PLP-dependent aminotransferase family protein [Tannerella sp.]|jgi:GntR family transcriptional regulator/MocR family aminotransferase|nr:PLP-dependent aminotransferase family protein [Tannerella sp.]
MLRPWPILLDISQDKSKPLYIRITDSIIEAIKKGSLKKGEALPGSRQMAILLDINRNTVTKAYEILLSEGWLVSEERKGTFVSENLQFTSPDNNKSLLHNAKKGYQTIGNIVFDGGLPDPSLMPVDEIAKAYRRIFSQKARRNILNVGSELGYDKFRNAVSQMLNQSKGMSTSANEICITRGSQMAFFLAAHCLLNPGDVVLIENPGYRPAWEAFEHAGAKLIPVDVDKNGINVEMIKLILMSLKIKAIYITPHHQFPTTVTLSLSRRLELISLSNYYGFTIIEDDYDSDYYFGKRSKTPVCAHKELKNFVYISTLSKLISPAIRIGYLYSNADFLNKVCNLRKIIDTQSDGIMEQSILELINSGDIRRHKKRMIHHYLTKRDLFAGLLHEYLKDEITFQKPDGGLAFWLTFNKKIDVFELEKKALKKGLIFLTPKKFNFAEPAGGLRIGYASLSEYKMKRGLEILAKCI